MAKCTVTYKEPIYNLELTEAEAMTLAKVCNNISGSPSSSRRMHTDSIERALRMASVPDTKEKVCIDPCHPTIRFLSGPIEGSGRR